MGAETESGGPRYFGNGVYLPAGDLLVVEQTVVLDIETVRRSAAGFGSSRGLRFGLAFYHFGERFFVSQVGFDLSGIGAIVREGCVNLGETEVPVLHRNLFRSQAHFVPAATRITVTPVPAILGRPARIA
jgi:hypothetical protein